MTHFVPTLSETQGQNWSVYSIKTATTTYITQL